jgi:hypothetical protein
LSSRRDTILDAMVALLGSATVNGHTKPSGLTVSRQRTLPFAASQLPAQAVYLVSEEVTTGPGRSGNRFAKRAMQFIVESRCIVATTPDQDIDPLVSWAVQALCATPQLTPGVHDIQEAGTVWDQVENDTTLAGARTAFRVEYITAASDPDSAT